MVVVAVAVFYLLPELRLGLLPIAVVDPKRSSITDPDTAGAASESVNAWSLTTNRRELRPGIKNNHSN
jgi:hypothetical protein